MRVHIELETQREADSLYFVTCHSSLGSYRMLSVRLNGRPFSVWYKLNAWNMEDSNYMKYVDEHLAVQFEQMLEKLLAVTIAKVPETDLIGLSTEDIVNLLQKESA